MIAPQIAEAVALLRQGRADGAAALAERLLAERPDDAGLLHLLGVARRALGRGDAEAPLRAALALRPDYAEAHATLGGLLLRQDGRRLQAAAALRAAIALKPERPQAYADLAATGDGTEMTLLGRAWLLGRDEPTRRRWVGVVTAAADGAAPERGLAAAALIAPDRLLPRWLAALAALAPVYDSEDHLQAARAAYAARLAEVADMTGRRMPADAVESLLRGVPYLLPYQGDNDVALQRLWGGILHRAARPHVPAPLSGPRPEARRRVAVVSAFFYRHSNWRSHLRFLVGALDRRRLHVAGFHLSRTHDAATDEAARLAETFVAHSDPLAMAAAIRDFRPDVVIHPEIGMSPLTALLAAMPLAPLQMTSWGHPETSGLPTIDAFLSSELMEPPDGDAWYGERLIRLPNLGVHWRHEPVPATPPGVALRGTTVRYWCCQNLRKYLPRHDRLLAEIAQQVGDCQFVFVGDERPAVTEALLRRLAAAFRAAGLDADRHLVMAPRLPLDRFIGLARLCHVYLDTPGWSGFNTALDSLDVGLPLVTLEQGPMRARHTAAILRRLGETATIAADEAEYVALAVRLGRDAEWRRHCAAAQGARRHLLWEDAAVPAAVTELLCDVV